MLLDHHLVQLQPQRFLLIQLEMLQEQHTYNIITQQKKLHILRLQHLVLQKEQIYITQMQEQMQEQIFVLPHLVLTHYLM